MNIVIATLQAMQLLLQQNHGFVGFAQAMEAEGVLSLFSLICCSYGYSPSKQERGRNNDRRPSSQAMEANDGAEQLAACITADDEDMQFQTVLVIMRASLLAPASLEFLNTPGVEELDPRSIRTRVCRGARARVTIDQSRHSVLRTFV